MSDANAFSRGEQIFTRLIERYALELPERLTLESKQDFIYLSDLDTYELYFISMNNPEQLHDSLRDYQGKKCYEVLQGRSTPCPFCTNHLLKKEMDYIWKFHNDIIDADYILKDRLVTWKGKTVRMEVVVDVSDPQRVESVLARSLANQNVLTACVRHMMQADTAQGASGYVLQLLCRFFEAEGGFIRCRGSQNILAQLSPGKTAEFGKESELVSDEALALWSEKLEHAKQVILKDTDELRGVDDEAWLALKKDGTSSLCATPIFCAGKLTGMIYLRNLRQHWTELSLLTMIAGFYSMLLQKDALEQDKYQLQYYDSVANCPSFQGFRLSAQSALREHPEARFALWYCDIKNFKLINDIFGYDTGDQLLRYWARLIEVSLCEFGTFGRVAGDKFAMLCEYRDTNQLSEQFAQMSERIAAFEPIAAKQYRTDVSAGVYLLDGKEGSLSIDEMLNRANMAQKTVKDLPGSRHAIYNESVRRHVLREILLEAAMQDALRKEEFKIYLQPQVALEAGRTVRAEALVRWLRPDGTLLPPNEFIGLFERDGLIVDLDRYVFEHVCRFERSWFDAGRVPLCISVNVSRISMLQPSFVEEYCRIKRQYGIPDGMIELEFTETIVIENYERFRAIVAELREAGFLCAMDDFGTSQSSLNLLRNLPLDVLKLDRLFFIEDENTERGRAIVGCVLQLAQALQMSTVAEGIETMPLVEELRRMGCDLIQGFVFARPMPAEEFVSLSDREFALYMGSMPQR